MIVLIQRLSGISYIGSSFLLLPLSFLLIKMKEFKCFIFSTVVSASSFYCFLNWIYDSLSSLKYTEVYHSIEDKPFNQFILYGSNCFEFILFPLVSILFICKSSF